MFPSSRNDIRFINFLKIYNLGFKAFIKIHFILKLNLPQTLAMP